MKKIRLFSIFLFLYFLCGFQIQLKAQGDSPCTATVMTVNNGVCGTYSTGTTVGATYSNNAANGGTPTCASPGAPDVWYSFVAPLSGQIIVAMNVGTITDSGIQIYSSSTNLCTGTLTALSCDNDNGPGLMSQLNLCGLTAGNTYFLRVWQYGGTGTGTFNICFYNTAITAATTNCNGATTVCSDAAFSGNSSGAGTAELNVCNRGCLGVEHQSSWYYFQTPTAGNLDLNITPSVGTDDYDFAVWGPFSSTTIPCPPSGVPLRCSYAAATGNTGISSTNNAPQTDLTEGSGGNKWVQSIAATAGGIYILLVDNFVSSTNPFTLNWTLSGGATLGCTTLPMELSTFEGTVENENIRLKWITFSESNNDYFTVEKSIDGSNFEEMNRVDGSGTSTQINTYSTLDKNPIVGINYYRIKQTDFNGVASYSSIISVQFVNTQVLANNVHPNPTNSEINFDFYSLEKGEIHVQIIDYTGRIVIDNREQINEGKSFITTQMNALASGIYTLKIGFDKTGYSSVSKVVKK